MASCIQPAASERGRECVGGLQDEMHEGEALALAMLAPPPEEAYA